MKPKPPLVKALAGLNAARVDYVMIGVLAINHYAKAPSSIYATLDCVPCADIADIADIEDVLEAKRRAGREKDKAFLKIYEARSKPRPR